MHTIKLENEMEPKVNSFCWAELAANSGEVAKGFYTGLLGWTCYEQKLPEGMGSYITAMVNNMPAAAMFTMSEELKKMNIPPHWASYIRVDNCDTAVAKALELKAEILKPAFDVMEAGRMAVIKDPCGGVVNLWEKKGHAGAAVQYKVAGTCCWNELMTHDPKLALDFYSKMFNWSVQASEFEGKTYYSLKHDDGTPIAGLMEISPDMPCPPAWVTYFTVNDLKASMEYVSKNGGIVHFGPYDVHRLGHFAACQDAEGAHFSLFQYSA